ncbi:MAG: accessory gene regulator B family protein [Lachnospiraceae bacterium]|nr:accessory gene regulator B family protein [Lachnospiraceae bacterium]
MKINLNDSISEKYIRLAEQYENYSYEQCERIKYALKVMLNEGEKVLLLCIIFAMLGECKAFLFSLCIVLSIRVTMGGMHRHTFWGCFFFSFGFFLSVIITSRYFLLSKGILVGLYIVYIAYILLRAPIPSQVRPIASLTRRKKLKGYSILVISIWISACLFVLKGQWEKYLEWTLLLQMIEILVVEGGRYICQKNK